METKNWDKNGNGLYGELTDSVSLVPVLNVSRAPVSTIEDVCLINKSDSTDYYIARDIADSVFVFNRIDGVFDACITKPNYVPYTTTCVDTYLQNITLAGTKTYDTSYAMIGSDVTNKVAHGPVVINSGSSIVKASQGATITKDFEVKTGGTIHYY